MAGTIFGLGLSQRVDSNGNPALGWLLYIFAANSSTPVNTYQDTALTVLNPWPIKADASGMMGVFWVADGSYRARGTSADGSVVYFDISTVLALGPSAGPAPSGGVDPTAIYQTGDVLWLDVQGVRTGWVRDNGRTIGSATSGATERANADTQPLFQFLWNTYSNTICPVVGGRGASAVADFTANKQITLPDKRGYVPGGLDDMGSSPAGRYAGVPVISGGVTTAGSVLGEATHVVAQAELPNLSLSTTIAAGQGSHNHVLQNNGVGSSSSLAGVGQPIGGAAFAAGNPQCGSFTLSMVAATLPAITGTTPLGGSGNAHNTTQQTILGTFYRKL